jgi:hypothetical protein
LTVPRVSDLVFIFCAPGLLFGGNEGAFGSTEGVRSSFHVLHSQTHFRWYRGRRVQFWAVPSASGLVFMFCAPGTILGGTEGAESNFHILRSRNRVHRNRGRRFQFSCFALPDSASAVPRAPSLIFMFCSPGLIFDSIEGVGSSFNVCDPFSRASLLERWIAEEGHRDPSKRASGVYYDFRMHI